MSENLIVKSCKQTCGACPSQWDIWTTDGQYIYARYRWGKLTLTFEVGTPESRILYTENIGDGWNGVLSTQELIDHTSSVLDWSLL